MRLIDADDLLEVLKTAVNITPITQQYSKEDVIRAIMDAPTVAHGTDGIMIQWTPDLDKLARDVAFRGMNEFSVFGKSIREWIEIILEQPGWVNVMDRIPEKYGPYLTLREGQMPAHMRMAVHFWAGDKDCKYWRGVEDGSRIVGITHWMPLPIPPEEG